MMSLKTGSLAEVNQDKGIMPKYNYQSISCKIHFLSDEVVSNPMPISLHLLSPVKSYMFRYCIIASFMASPVPLGTQGAPMN